MPGPGGGGESAGEDPGATLSVTLGAATCSSTATLGLSGSSSKTLASTTCSGTATVPGNLASLRNTYEYTVGPPSGYILDDTTATGAAALAETMVGQCVATLGNASLQSTSTYGSQSTVNIALDGLLIQGEATVVGNNTATLSKTLGAVTASATATVASDPVGRVTKTLGAATSSATATVAAGMAGSVVKTLASVSRVSTATVTAGMAANLARTLATTASVGAASTPPPRNSLYLPLVIGTGIE